MNEKLREALEVLEAVIPLVRGLYSPENIALNRRIFALQVNLREALAASKQEPQAQAEPQVVDAVPVAIAESAVRYVGAANYDSREREALRHIRSSEGKYITLQSHREAVAKETEAATNAIRRLSDDLFQREEAIANYRTALKACVEALHSIDQQIDLSKYPSAPPDVTLLDELRAAITKAKEAME